MCAEQKSPFVVPFTLKQGFVVHPVYWQMGPLRDFLFASIEDGEESVLLGMGVLEILWRQMLPFVLLHGWLYRGIYIDIFTLTLMIRMTNLTMQGIFEPIIDKTCTQFLHGSGVTQSFLDQGCLNCAKDQTNIGRVGSLG